MALFQQFMPTSPHTSQELSSDMYVVGDVDMSEIPVQSQQLIIRPVPIEMPSMGRTSSYGTMLPFKCPHSGCLRAFPLKKTLVRHQQSVHQPGLYSCFYPGCVKHFKRKDIRDRHEVEQHGETRDTIHCPTCKKDIRRRVIEDHWKTRYHRKREQVEDERKCLAIKTELNMAPANLPTVEASVDPSLITAYMFWEIDERSLALGLQFEDLTSAMLSSDIMELRGLSYRVLMRMRPQSVSLWTPQMVFAIVQMARLNWVLSDSDYTSPLDPHMRSIRLLLEHYGGPVSLLRYLFGCLPSRSRHLQDSAPQICEGQDEEDWSEEFFEYLGNYYDADETFSQHALEALSICGSAVVLGCIIKRLREIKEGVEPSGWRY